MTSLFQNERHQLRVGDGTDMCGLVWLSGLDGKGNGMGGSQDLKFQISKQALSSTIPAGLAGGVTTATKVVALVVLIFGVKDLKIQAELVDNNLLKAQKTHGR